MVAFLFPAFCYSDFASTDFPSGFTYDESPLLVFNSKLLMFAFKF